MRKAWFLILAVICILFVAGFSDDPVGTVTINRVSFLNQTNNIATTNLATPANDGDYEVVVYMTAHNPSSLVSGMLPNVSWTDEIGNQSNILRLPSYTFGAGNGSGYECSCSVWSFVYPIHVAGGNPIQFSAQYDAGTGTPNAFDVFVTLKKD
jgi:hypothetical protein